MPAVKVCGITQAGDALALAFLGVWALGFIFVPGSPRFVHPETVRGIVGRLRGKVLTVGVFQNSSIREVQGIRDFCELDLVQLHGDEDPAFCERLGGRVIKAFGVGEGFSLKEVEEYLPRVSYVLFDTLKGERRGGTGEVFRWEVVAPFVSAASCPTIVAGGLTLENIPRLLRVLRPFALDVNSGFEIAPGRKNIQKVRELLVLLQGR
ncbi:phosphoribosylanthranilate isomerase [Candidatus Caldatribacterium sp. SIUC1]|uniref:phosphoribosylanthranilate isomerase n=1 Tax=Candidatus Caldatribacterium sp. SIUC1 TaxID=3418365 RepID=UPI003F68D802